MSSDLSSAFRDAAAYLSSASSLSKVSTVTKLELYGLFKHLTVAPAPNTSRPSIFDMTGRAKWDAWSAAFQSYGTQSGEAEQRYLSIAGDLGWTESSGVTTTPGVLVEDGSQGSEGDIWDKADAPSNHGAGGMGNSVSAVASAPLDERDAKTPHGMAVSNDVAGLEAYLNAHPEADLNELDEYGYTPLHLACDRGNSGIVRTLLARGADRSLKDPDEFTALELANVAGHDDIVALITE
ncbi:ankyrin [Athelia psychrophila]|uniref:Ankyrin n=1 Tax=Athelia psychrophila TaxID=1759441 RepID=A0A166FII6_9AGAM|nr:ankyrin [Fibularhizoctonia sp. CBS 109695]